jgi:glycosidase
MGGMKNSSVILEELLKEEKMKKIKERLLKIYTEHDVGEVFPELKQRIAETIDKQLKKRKANWDEKDIVLITYADQFYEDGEAALSTFKKMYDSYFGNVFEIVHLLPFYPYSSDDGFSVIDYKGVNPINGDWKEVQRLSTSTRLMFDYVCNHISAKSEWFQEYLKNNKNYKNFFIEVDSTFNTTNVIRPRSTSLITKFELENGETKNVWTTFSEDQIDLNFRNPRVLLEMIDILLFYIEQGAEYIRLDAVGFMWKEDSTTCMHLEKTHELIKLFRDIVDLTSEGTVIITETNVPHLDNISYFGNGHDEAHMVYQFPLPPLILYSLFKADGTRLSEWAKNLDTTSSNTTYFNFLASHDGIGMNPLRGIIEEDKILELVNHLKKQGALVSYKNNQDGSVSPYEVNVTYLDALNNAADEDTIRIKRFMLTHSILLTLPGVPAIYVQSILGSRNYYAGVSETGMNRTINRKKYNYKKLVNELSDEQTLRNKIYHQLSNVISARKNEPLFHPSIPMRVRDFGSSLFVVERYAENEDKILVIHNLTNEEQQCSLVGSYVDVLTGKEIISSDTFGIEAYQFLWLKTIN